MSSIGAVGPSVFPGQFGTGKSGIVLAAQLARYQVQLADWVSCPSCKTPEGKAKIRELSDKVRETQQRIDTADARRQTGASTGQVVVSPAAAGGGATPLAPSELGSGSDSFLPHSTSATGNIGTRLNVYA